MGDRSQGQNKARLIVVDPRFTRSAALADLYAPIRTGTDIAFLGGVINYLIAGTGPLDYVKSYTDMSFLVKDEFAFADGFFGLRRRQAQLRQGRLGLPDG
jgi:formate dehydrogenase major subunit